MKKIIIALLCTAGSMTAMADEYQYLTMAYNSVEQSIELATIKKITFENSQVVVTTTAGQVTFPQSEMEKMFFSTTATAIESLSTESADIKMQDGLLRANGTGLLHIYNSAGALIHMAKVDGSANISLSNLPKGVYVVSMGKQTIKVIK